MVALIPVVLLMLALVCWSSWISEMPFLPIRKVRLRSCGCGAHWWIRRWFFWRHMDASPFNDKLQDRWTIWMFEFRHTLVLNHAELKAMGYPQGPLWENGRPMWMRSKLQLSISPGSYCLRCARRSL